MSIKSYIAHRREYKAFKKDLKQAADKVSDIVPSNPLDNFHFIPSMSHSNSSREATIYQNSKGEIIDNLSSPTSTGVFFEFHDPSLDASLYSGEPTNPPENEVIARISNTPNDATVVIRKLLSNSKCGLELPWYSYRYLMEDEYSSHAKCNMELDAFNLPEGKNISKTRVLAKYHNDLNRQLCTFLKNIRTLEAHTIKYMEKHGLQDECAKVPTTKDIYDKSFVPSKEK